MELSRRQFLQVAAGVGTIAAVGGIRNPAWGQSSGVWLAGDFHCHTVFSHDVYGGPSDDNTGLDEFYTFGHTPAEQIKIAELRGLDFLAITDHNDVRSALQPDYASSKLLLVPGYEHSLSGGHAGVFVPSVGSLAVIEDPTYGRSFEGDVAFTRFLELVGERNGMVVLNHPFDGGVGSRTWTYGEAVSQGVAAVEAWNTAWLARYEVSPLYETNNHLSVQWWESHFAQGHAMVGGSDNHWKLLDLIAGVGQPTTWVYAADRSVGAVLDAVRAGRTFISSQPPLHGGARLYLSATEDWGTHATAGVGDAVSALGRVVGRVRVINGIGSVLRFVSTDPTTGKGMVVGTKRILLPNEVVERPVVLPEGGALRAELYNHKGLLMRAITSAITTAGTAPPDQQRPVTTGPQVTYSLLPLVDTTGIDASALPECECTH